MEYGIHAVAKLIPEMTEAEYASLRDDIARNGQYQAILVHEGEVIDGRHRYRACKELGISPKVREWDGKGSLVLLALGLNIKRRHLSSSQLAAIAVEALPLLEREAKARQKEAGSRGKEGGRGKRKSKTLGEQIPQGLDRSPKSSDQAAESIGVSGKYVSEAKRIKVESPELFEEIKAGRMTVTQAKRELREAKREKRRKANAKKASRAKNVLEVGAKFSVIVLDPPWDWGDEGDVNQLGRAKPDYATMGMDELLSLPVGELSDEDCHLYMWITNRSLPKGFALLERWGFRYVTMLTWGKKSFGMGNYFRGQTEHVLFGVKGSQMLKRKDAGTLLPSWDRGPDGHSSKPVEFYEFVESCSPGPYVELFSRVDRKGWSRWGADA